VVIYYTTNGEAPTTSSAKYTTAGIKVLATETIRAIAVATGYSPECGSLSGLHHQVAMNDS